MNRLTLTIAFLIIFAMSCSKDETLDLDCIERKLEEFNMVKFSGQEIGCEFFLDLYLYENEQYFLLGSHCVDMISYPIDCEGNSLCENGADPECKKFYKNSTRIGIVGIGE
jgi:hypothetical protein